MSREETVSRATLARYAGLLGRGSLAYKCLLEYDRRRAAKERVRIAMVNSGFYLHTQDGPIRFA